MSGGHRSRDRGDLLVRSTLVLAGVLCAWQLVAAVRLTPTDASPGADPSDRRGEPQRATDAALTPDAVAHVVSRDPFAPSRQAPVTPYRLGDIPAPGEETDIVAQPEPVRLPEVRGTAVGPGDEAFAMCAWDGGPVLVVRPGDAIGPFTVLVIERARVIFRDASGRRVTVESTASPDGAAP